MGRYYTYKLYVYDADTPESDYGVVPSIDLNLDEIHLLMKEFSFLHLGKYNKGDKFHPYSPMCNPQWRFPLSEVLFDLEGDEEEYRGYSDFSEKWYEHRGDMIEISRLFPQYTFVLYCEDEEEVYDDDGSVHMDKWSEIFKQGEITFGERIRTGFGRWK